MVAMFTVHTSKASTPVFICMYNKCGNSDLMSVLIEENYSTTCDLII